MTNKYKLGALLGFMEIPPGSQEDQGHKQATYFAPWLYLVEDHHPDFKAFFFFSAAWVLCCTCGEVGAYFHSFAFLPNFDFQKIARHQLQIGDVSLPNLVLVSKLNQMPECWSTTKIQQSRVRWGNCLAVSERLFGDWQEF